MPQTVLVWAEDEDRSGVEKGLAAGLLEDQTYTTLDQIQFPSQLPFILGMDVGTEFAAYPIIEARLASPNINGRGVNNFRMSKGYANENKSDLIFDFFKVPFVPNNGQGIGGQQVHGYSLETDEAGVAHFNSVAMFVGDGAINYRPHRLTHIVDFTVAATTAAVSWKSDTPTLTDDIPAGNYLIWGADLISATAVAARLKLPKQQWKPGFIPRRNEDFAMHPFNQGITNNGLPYQHRGGTIDIKIEYMTTATETPEGGKLFMQFLGPS